MNAQTASMEPGMGTMSESRRSTYLYLAALTISFLDTLFPTFLSLSIDLTFSWFRPDRKSREPSVDAWS